MTPVQIFAVQFALSLTVYALIARWFVAPRLAAMPLHDALVPLLLLQAFRHMGLVFLLPGFVGAPLPAVFAVPTASGDLATGLLAILAVVALRRRWRAGIPLAWAANLLGALDFLYGFYQGTRLEVNLGAAYYIPTVVNPAMWVSHALAFWLLVRRARPVPARPA